MPGAAPHALDLRVTAKTYAANGAARQPVLRNIHVRAGAGEVLALLGRSGSGKTTLLRIALGLDRDFDGTLAQPPGRIGAVFQEPRLLPWLTVEDNLRLVVVDGVPPPDIASLLAAVGLPDVAPRRPAELSLGMARRVALARALAVAPALLVLDEPFASLDPRLATTLADIVADHAKRCGASVLMATHDLSDALAIADRILVLHGHPATLAADIAVPDRSDATALARLSDDLLERFSFLSARESEPALDKT